MESMLVSTSQNQKKSASRGNAKKLATHMMPTAKKYVMIFKENLVVIGQSKKSNCHKNFRIHLRHTSICKHIFDKPSAERSESD